jgi:DNA-binding transcriptional regulator YdaS (Cro superfamily)
MKIDQAIAHFGSQVALANALGVQQPAVSMWKSRGAIPHLQQIRIEHLTKGKLKAKPLLPLKGKRTVSRT